MFTESDYFLFQPTASFEVAVTFEANFYKTHKIEMNISALTNNVYESPILKQTSVTSKFTGNGGTSTISWIYGKYCINMFIRRTN